MCPCLARREGAANGQPSRPEHTRRRHEEAGLFQQLGDEQGDNRHERRARRTCFSLRDEFLRHVRGKDEWYLQGRGKFRIAGGKQVIWKDVRKYGVES